ncbi:hypothetical protein DFR86_08795 [Acidianus sulfidivorans JP7]|uniref:Uncharacterized protein n=1 Tax=Acidianus sulfidivorans JP7 TaxID=619593 RepID=A0A2U9INT1_9CREN|nr:hypothetical protein [Acidianus sulfidivorans]AWR97634.1 hypothetical protein DFR86_08795 [Acidianus sulfidivorans JP7]
MTRINIFDSVVDKYNNYLERVIITALNSILIFLLLNKLGYQTYVDIIIPIVAIVSIVLPEVMAPIITLLFAIDKLYTLYDAITPFDILDSFFIIVLTIIIPIVLEIKYQSLQAFISAESVLGIPLTSILILAGISERRTPSINILSSLPLFYLLINLIKTNFYFSTSEIEILAIGILGILLGSYIFGINRIFSIAGILPSIIGFYALYFNSINFRLTDLIAEIIIISIAISGVSALLSSMKENKTKKEKIQEQIGIIKKEIDETLLTIGRIKSYAELQEKFENAIIKEEENLIDLSKKLDKCEDLKCINSIYPQFKDKKREITDKINDILFNIIIDYNGIVDYLKKYGIKIDEIPIPKDKVNLTETDIDNIQRILADINKNTTFALNYINSIIDSLEKINGIKLNRYYITDYSVLPKAIEELEKNNAADSATKIIEIDREILSNLTLNEYRQEKLELAKIVNDFYSRKILVSDIPQIDKITEKILELVLKYINSSINTLSSLLNVAKVQSIENLLNLTKEIKNSLEDQKKSIYEKLSYLIASVPSLKEVDEILENEDGINALFTILKDNGQIIENKILEDGCIKVEDIGINSKLSKYVAEYLSKDGIKTEIVKDQVCISK